MQAHSNNAYIREHTVSPELKDILDAHRKDIKKFIKHCDEYSCKKMNSRELRKLPGSLEKHTKAWQLPFLPGYFLKHGITRIEGAEKIRAAARSYGLNRITAPEKFLYHIPGRSYELNNLNYFIIAPKLHAHKKHHPFTEQDVKQLCTLIKVTGYCDVHSRNIMRLENNQMAFIDTDDWAFGHEPYKGLLRLISHFGHFNLHRDFTESALKYILSQLYTCRPTDIYAYRDFYYELKEALKKKRNLLHQFEKKFPKPIAE